MYTSKPFSTCVKRLIRQMRYPDGEGEDQFDCGSIQTEAQAQAPPSIDLSYYPGPFLFFCFDLNFLCQSHPRYEDRITTSTHLLQLCSQTMFTIGVVGKCDGCVETQQEAAPFSKAENDRQEHFSSCPQRILAVEQKCSSGWRLR